MSARYKTDVSKAQLLAGIAHQYKTGCVPDNRGKKIEPTFTFEDDFGDMDTLATTAIESQVGGDHYTKQKIQPLELTFANKGYEGVSAAIYTKVNKYLTREKGTHRQDLTKAIHVLQMQLEFYDRFNAVDTLATNHNMQPVEGNK